MDQLIKCYLWKRNGLIINNLLNLKIKMINYMVDKIMDGVFLQYQELLKLCKIKKFKCQEFVY